MLTRQCFSCIIAPVKKKALQQWTVVATEKKVEISYLFDFYGEILSEKQQLAVELYYNDDLSLSEVAAQLGISRQGVRDSLKRSESVLYEMEEKLGLAAKFGSVLEGISKIKGNAEKVNDYCLQNGGSAEVLAWLSEIMQAAEELEKRF